MQAAEQNICPLSPYMWSAPKQVVVASGSQVGSVANVLHHLADLELAFDLIVKEMVPPYNHPVYEAFQHHQVHTAALNKRQFDVIRYGMVLDKEERLVMVPAPRGCADSGVRVAREFNAIFHGDLNTSAISKHPLLPEYCFVVYKFPEAADGEEPNSVVPTPLFRVVFRNEAYNESGIAEMCETFPLFRLRAIFVSNKTYYPIMKELYSYRQNHPGVFTTEEGKVLPNPKVEQIILSEPIKELCEVWMKVLDGIAPTWVKEKGVGPDVVGLFLSTHRAKGRGAVQDKFEKDTTNAMKQVDNRVRVQYTANYDRMVKRVEILKRERGMVNRWRDGEFDLPYYAEENTGAEPEMETAKCARILMRLTRSGTNELIDGEICAFVPEDWEYKDQRVYRTPAAEKLRLWVLKGLMAAEIHNIHAVLLEVDTTLLLSQCIGLLWGDNTNEDRIGEASFHICKIVVETVEDYIQHSGVIWKASIVVCDEESERAMKLCAEILELTQSTKNRVEIQERQKELDAPREEAERQRRRELLEQHLREKARADAEAGIKKPSYYDKVVESLRNGESGALVVRDEKPRINFSDLCSSIPSSIANRAHHSGLHITDANLYPLFESLLDPNAEVLTVTRVVEILMYKLDPSKSEYTPWPNNHPLLALDSCGIPCDEKRVKSFVMGFCHIPYNEIRSARNDDSEPTLNYVEFSMMMLALACQ